MYSICTKSVHSGTVYAFGTRLRSEDPPCHQHKVGGFYRLGLHRLCTITSDFCVYDIYNKKWESHYHRPYGPDITSGEYLTVYPESVTLKKKSL